MAVCFTPKSHVNTHKKTFYSTVLCTVPKLSQKWTCSWDTSNQEQLQLCAGAAARVAASGLKLESGGRSAIHTLAHILNPIGAKVGVHYALSLLKMRPLWRRGGRTRQLDHFGQNFIKMWRKRCFKMYNFINIENHYFWYDKTRGL